MIYIQHDFLKNFTQSINTGDITTSLDIFRSELSDLLTYKSDTLYTLCEKVNVKCKKNASYEELLNTILREIQTNDKFVRGLSFLIGENNQVIKNNSGTSWDKLLNQITKGVKVIANYFKEHPKQESLFKRRAIDMIGLKSSITGDDTRSLNEKDNTVAWFLAITALCVGGYFVYKYFDKIKQNKMRADSLIPKMEFGGGFDIPINNSAPINTPPPVVTPSTAVNPQPNMPVAGTTMPNNFSNDAGYNVSEAVLIPMQPVQPMQGSGTTMPIQNAQPVMAQQAPISQMSNPNAF